jgi:DNA-binding transcriptional MerR regulator
MDESIKIKKNYKTIGEVTNELNLINKKTGKLQTHTIRFWETQFKQIKPFIMSGKRRYYSNESFQVLKNIKFLLKDKGLTIQGAKKILNKENTHLLDADFNAAINTSNLTNTKIIKDKIKNISKIIKELKNLK